MLKAEPEEGPGAGGEGICPELCICVCWNGSLDGALPLGQEALISCGGGVGRIRSGGLSSGPSLMSFRATEEHFLSKAASPKPGEAGRSALVRRPKLRPEKEAMRARRWCVCLGGGGWLVVGNTAGSLVSR